MVGSLALTGCRDNTHIKKVGDLTGDSIQDVLMYESGLIAGRCGNILFVGQKNGEFVKAREVTDGWRNSSGYFETDEDEKYFFDGKSYRLALKQKE